MATNNVVNVGLSGSTGSGSFVGSTSPTLVTPTLGAASATSISFSSTSGIIGTTTNNSAASGSVGQFLSSIIAQSSPVALTNNTALDVTSISLTAGDWDVWGNIGFTGNAATNVTFLAGWVSSTSATTPDPSLYSSFSYSAAGFLPYSGATFNFVVPEMRFSLSGATTVYLSAISLFTVNTSGAYGGIYARRVR